NNDKFYGAPDSLIAKTQPLLCVSNVSDEVVKIKRGDVLGYARRPDVWLDKESRYITDQRITMQAHASLLRTFATEQAQQATMTGAEPVELHAAHRLSEEDDPLASEPLEGGPKTSEAPPEDISEGDLFCNIDISKDLSEEQQQRLREVAQRNWSAFSLNGRLGTVKARCTILLRPGAKEVSLPPFPSSPAKREAI
ncbi:hypothetical protein LXA43DRAFT_863474, partial [Ganoderma leucocontextum]